MDNSLLVSDEDRKNLAELVELYTSHSRGFGSMIRSRKYSELLAWLDGKTPLL